MNPEVSFCVADGVPPCEFDLVVANLPYLTRTQCRRQYPEFDNEPDIGNVVSGEDPLEIIRSVVAGAPHGLRIALQHPLESGEAVSQLLTEPHLLFPGRRPSVTLGRIP